MKGPRLAVSGSRYMLTGRRLERALHDLRPRYVLVGDAHGCDELVVEWCKDHDVRFKVFRADWMGQGTAAGPIRNKRILVEGKPDFWIAFPFANSRGTKDFILQARKLEIPGVILDNGDAEPIYV